MAFALPQHVLSKSELEQLMNKAKQNTWGRMLVKFAYRNKSTAYFDDILSTKDEIMKVYMKDNNGDPGCPINGRIKGLFFAVRPEPGTTQPQSDSLFGPRRITLPVEKLIESDVKLYFADFYCHKRIHYLTLVATKPYSSADLFCRAHLIELPEDNPFFKKEGGDFYCSTEPRVEILYTEDVDLKADYIEWDTVPIIGRGSSTPGGLPKRRSCTVCNLKPAVDPGLELMRLFRSLRM